MLRRSILPLLISLLLAALGCPTDGLAPVPVEDVDATVDEVIGTLVTVTWEQLEPGGGYLSYAVDEGEWQQTDWAEYEPGPQSQLLVGLPYEADITLGVMMDPGSGLQSSGTLQLRTADLPEGLPRPEILVSDPDGWDDSWRYLLASIDEGEVSVRFWTHILDREGRVVWAWRTPPSYSTLQAQPTHAGDALYIEYNSYWGQFDDGAASVVNRVTLDGTVHEVIDTPGLHHPYTETDAGTLVWGASNGGVETMDYLTADGERGTFWDCATYQADVGLDGWCSSNTLWWNEADATFLFSFFSMETVLEIDGVSGEVLRSFGHAPGSWAFDPPEAAFRWQHGTVYTEDDTLLVSSRLDGPGEDEHETVVYEYALDHGSETLTEVWSFAVGDDIYGDMMGEAHRLPGGNTLHNMGTAARVREATPDGEVVWDLTWEAGQFLGRTTPLPDLELLLPPELRPPDGPPAVSL